MCSMDLVLLPKIAVFPPFPPITTSVSGEMQSDLVNELLFLFKILGLN